MNILITGGAGFIGSHLATLYQGRAKIRVLDNLRTGHRHNLAGLAAEFIEGSILDPVAVQSAMLGIDYVFHLAAFVSVPESVREPATCTAINITGLQNVLAAAAQASVKKLCFASSAAVYGDNPSVPKFETMTPEPRSPYAETKLAGEVLCAEATARGSLATVALRFFNVFGPRQDPTGPYGAAVPIFFREALAGRPITIHGDGSQTRDFIDVRDIVGALDFVAQTPGLTGVFNAGYGEQSSVLALAQRIIALTDSPSPILFAPERAGDVRHSRANVDRLRAAGWRPTGSLDLGLAHLCAHLRSA